MKTFSGRDDSNRDSISIGSSVRRFSNEIYIFDLKIIFLNDSFFKNNEGNKVKFDTAKKAPILFFWSHLLNNQLALVFPFLI